MTYRIGLISDIHASPAPLKEALSIFKQQKVDMILCPGDIAGYGELLDETVELLIESQCQSILGNHEVWHLNKSGNNDNATTSYFNQLPDYLEFSIEGKKIYMVHANPPNSYEGGIRLLDEHGCIVSEQKTDWTKRLAEFDYDVLIVGHTHQVFAERLGSMLVINPGSTTYNHSCAILKLPDKSVQFFALSNIPIVKSWNWGTNQI